jgi:hypothetical protein
MQKDTKSGYIDSIAWVMRSFLLVFIPISIFLLLLLLFLLTFVRLETNDESCCARGVGIKKVMLLR